MPLPAPPIGSPPEHNCELAHTFHECVLIGYRDQRHSAGMASLAQKLKAEKRMRELLQENELPQPDWVEYGFSCVRFFFRHTKHVVIIDIDEAEDGEAEVDTDAA